MTSGIIRENPPVLGESELVAVQSDSNSQNETAGLAQARLSYLGEG